MENRDQQWQQLLDKWHSGQFDRSDEAALKQLLEKGDDFVREATQGYWNHPEDDHEARLQRLSDKLAQTPSEEKPAVFPWLRIAAALLLLLAAGIWWFNRTEPAPQIAQALPPTPPATEVAPPAAPQTAADRATRPSGTPTRTEGLGNSNTPSLSAPLAQDAEAVKAAEDVAVLENSANAEAAPPPVDAKMRGGALKVEEPAKTDDLPQGFPAANATPSIQREALPNAKKKTRVAAVVPEPVVGWSQFRADMEKQLELTKAAKDNGVTGGAVSMILEINPKDGKVRSVLLVNTLGYGCDEAAERFVRQYDWKLFPNGPTKIEVEVEFRK